MWEMEYPCCLVYQLLLRSRAKQSFAPVRSQAELGNENKSGEFAFPKSMTYVTCVLCFGEKERTPGAAGSEGIAGGPFSFPPPEKSLHCHKLVSIRQYPCASGSGILRGPDHEQF